MRWLAMMMLLITGACRELRPQEVVVRERTLVDAGFEVMPWGTYATTLNVRACQPADPILTVDTALDELDAEAAILNSVERAGAHLSLREALWVAKNRLGPDTILFDEAAFPLRRPATISMSEQWPLPNQLAEVCIDGRERGVIIDWPQGDVLSMWGLGAGSLQVGLTFLHTSDAQMVQASQVAGCRYTTDGVDVFKPHFSYQVLVASNGAQVGPGNVFSALAPVTVASITATISDNWFGFDPVTRRQVGASGRQTFHVTAGGRIAHNFFTTVTFKTTFYSGSSPLKFQYNRVGVDEAGQPLHDDSLETSVSTFGISGLSPGANANVPFILGPGNIIRGHATAIVVGGSPVTITQNEITANDAGIVFTDGFQDPPSVVSVSPTGVDGHCAVDGVIEVFADEGAQGRLYLGATAGAPITGWHLAVDLTKPSLVGLNITATLTNKEGQTSGFSVPVLIGGPKP